MSVCLLKKEKKMKKAPFSCTKDRMLEKALLFL